MRCTILLGTALITQFLCGKFFSVSAFDPRSALISGLSLCLLLRTNSTLLLILTAVVTIASKFVVKWNRKHIFNPTNFGIVAMLALNGRSLGLAGTVGQQTLLRLSDGLPRRHGRAPRAAQRRELRIYFSYAAILFGRAYWLGDPLAIPLKQLQSGALLLFTFFMISDPKTTPDSRAGRILFRAARRRRRRLHSIRPLPHQRIALVAGDLFRTDTADRLPDSWNKVPMEQPKYRQQRRSL